MPGLADSVKRPFTDPKKLLIGLLLQLIPPFGCGYYLVCADNPSGDLPEWTDFLNLFLKGLGAIVVSLLYLAPSLLVLFLAFLFTAQKYFLEFTESWMNLERALQAVTYLLSTGNATFSVGLMLAILVLLVSLYLLPLALAKYAVEKHFSSPFHIKDLAFKALTKDYLTSLVGVVAYLAFLAFLVYLLFTYLPFPVPLIGLLIAAFLLGVTSMSRIGEAYASL